jgi:hypothetical protein
LCPRTRGHPVGFGYRNYFVVVKHAHGAACSQVTVEQVIKTTSVELSQRIQELWIQKLFSPKIPTDVAATVAVPGE